MKVTERKCKINGIHIAEVTLKNMPNTSLTLEAIYALGEMEERQGRHVITGTHGKCTAYAHCWSKGTMELLEELMRSMEEDLLPRHFELTAGMEDTDEGIESGEDEAASQI